jgi:signal peptidase I
MRVVIRELFETVILVLVIFLALQSSVRNYRVEGPSMQPALEEGEFVLVNKIVYLRFKPSELARLVPFLEVEGNRTLFPFHSPQRGEVIIFRFPRDLSRDFVKRVIALPGDTVEISRGQVIVNGRSLDEPYILRRDNGSYRPTEIPEDSYFVLGDNRQASNDSRDWGVVHADNIVGRAWVSFWPLNRWHALDVFRWLGVGESSPVLPSSRSG